MQLNPFKRLIGLINRMRVYAWLVVTLVICTLIGIGLRTIILPEKISSTQPKMAEAPFSETSLNTVRITEAAYQKLGIQHTTVTRKHMTLSQSYGGDILIPSGNVVTLSTPLSGKLLQFNKNALQPGTPVHSGQLLYRILPIISTDTRANLVNALADADSQVKVAQTQVESSKVALTRAKKLLEDLAGSQRSVDDATASYQLAERNLEAAMVKKNALQQMVSVGTLQALDFRAPKTGVISNLFASNDQLLSAGNPILEISSYDTLWCRVQVPSSELETIDKTADAEIQLLSGKSDSEPMLVKPIIGLPTADPLTGTVHLYFAIDQNRLALLPQQRVAVSLKTRKFQETAISVPYSAVVFDIYGNSWVYQQVSTNHFKRIRVSISHVSRKTAYISEGLPEGVSVVTNGALELFAVETGFSH